MTIRLGPSGASAVLPVRRALQAKGVHIAAGLLEHTILQLLGVATPGVDAEPALEVETREFAAPAGSGRWVEVVVRDPRATETGGHGHRDRSRVVRRFLATSPLGSRAIISTSRSGTDVSFIIPCYRASA